MTPTTDRKILLDIKKYIDNGFSGAQAAHKAGVSPSIVVRLNHGFYGEFPTFPPDPELRAELRQLNLDKMRIKLKKRKVPGARKR